MTGRPAATARAGVCLALVACGAGPGWAATGDREQPATIQADRVNIDQQRNRSRYLGNVVFAQGTVRITGDEVLLFTHQGELQRLEATGTPAGYDERDDAGRPLRARARRIVYDADASLLVLDGDARLCRAGEYFRAERIEYQTETRTVEAGRVGASDGERVHITLRPGTARAPEEDCSELP